jgi:4-amino-4-deoxy-L-arabinose transferase-like glycosyltransferase
MRLAVLVALCLVLFSSGLGRRAIWDTDEGKHATTAKTMVQSGDWITPRLEGKPFYDKPPLFFWLVASSFSLLGFTELAARLPAALLGLATVLVTYGFGRQAIGPRAAFLGAVVLASTLEFVVLSNVVVHDIALVLCIAVALFAFERARDAVAPCVALLVLAYAAMGLGVVAKGPIGLLLPAGVIVLTALLRRELPRLREAMPLAGAAIVLLVALPWYVAVSLADPEYLSYFLVEKNLGSFFSRASSHPKPLWFYGPVLLLGFFPWSSFLVAALARLARRPARIDESRLYLLVWTGFVFLFFSLATSKLETYLLPLFPPAALLVGDLWSETIGRVSAARPRWLVAAQLFLIGILACAVPFFWQAATRHPMYDAHLHRRHLLALSAILVGAAVLGSLLLALRRHAALFAVNALLMAAIVLYGLVVLIPVIDPYRSTREIARDLDRLLPPGEKLAFYHEVRESALFYTDREALLLETPEALAAYLERPGALCVVDGSWYPTVEHLAQRFERVEQRANKIVIRSRAEPVAGGVTSASTAPASAPGSSPTSTPAPGSSPRAAPD